MDECLWSERKLKVGTLALENNGAGKGQYCADHDKIVSQDISGWSQVQLNVYLGDSLDRTLRFRSEIMVS